MQLKQQTWPPSELCPGIQGLARLKQSHTSLGKFGEMWEHCVCAAFPHRLKRLQVVLSQPLSEPQWGQKFFPCEPWEMIIRLKLPTHHPSWHCWHPLVPGQAEQHRHCSSVCHVEKNAVPIMKPGEKHSQGSLDVNVLGLNWSKFYQKSRTECFRKLSACVPVHSRSQQSTLVSLSGALCWIRPVQSWRKCSCPCKMFGNGRFKTCCVHLSQLIQGLKRELKGILNFGRVAPPASTASHWEWCCCLSRNSSGTYRITPDLLLCQWE